MKNKVFENYIKEKNLYSKNFEAVKERTIDKYQFKEFKKDSSLVFTKIGMVFVTFIMLLFVTLVVVDERRYVEASLSTINIYGKNEEDGSLALIKDDIKLVEGESIKLIISKKNDLKNVKWSSSDTRYMYISKDGTLTALQATDETLFIVLEGVNKKGIKNSITIPVYISK